MQATLLCCSIQSKNLSESRRTWCEIKQDSCKYIENLVYKADVTVLFKVLSIVKVVCCWNKFYRISNRSGVAELICTVTELRSVHSGLNSVISETVYNALETFIDFIATVC